jgi:nicotinate-nucleotide adenylyltransferase
MNIGLYFGSFNPIHTGHLIIAQHVLNNCSIKQLWFVVSPHNPLKESKDLLDEYKRLHLVKLAIEDYPSLKASDIEFKLPKPSYTIDTLTYLKEKYPTYNFSIIMGSDSYTNLPKWKNHQQLLNNYEIIVYQRPHQICTPYQSSNTIILQAPLLDISATYIRQQIKAKKDISFLVPEVVAQAIKETNLYL